MTCWHSISTPGGTQGAGAQILNMNFGLYSKRAFHLPVLPKPTKLISIHVVDSLLDCGPMRLQDIQAVASYYGCPLGPGSRMEISQEWREHCARTHKPQPHQPLPLRSLQGLLVCKELWTLFTGFLRALAPPRTSVLNDVAGDDEAHRPVHRD